MCMPKPKPDNTKAPEAAPAPAPVADAIKSPNDDLTISRAAKGASKLSKSRSALGGTGGNSGLGL